MSNSFTYWLIGGLVITLATVLVVWIRHNFKIKKITFKTGLVDTELERNEEKQKEIEGSASTNVSGNKMFGRNKILIRREKTNVSDNTMAGANEIEVGAKPGPKPKGKTKK